MKTIRRTVLGTTAAAVALLLSASSSATTPADPTPECVVIKRGVRGDVPDAYIWDKYPDYNTGTAVSVDTGLSNSGGEKKGLIGFDLSSIPAGSTITSAKLYLYLIFDNTSQPVRAHRVLSPWSETTVTWNNFGGIDPVSVAETATGNFGWRSLELTGLVQDWIHGVVPNHGVLLEEGILSNSSFRSSNYNTSSYFPYLDVCYTEPLGSIGDTVWFDGNADGVQDASEPGIAGVVLDLFGDADCDGDADGAALASTATGSGGLYHFGDLAAGCYVVDVDEATLPPGHFLTTVEEPFSVEIGTGEDYDLADFGYVTYSSIGDTVWLDSDADGAYEPETGELGVNGVVVELKQGATVIDFTTTSDSPYTGQPGWYLFDTLPQGGYTVVVAASNFDVGGPLAGYEATFDYDGNLDGSTDVALGVAQDFLLADFGYRLSCGNGVCGGDESCSTCAVDCGACPPVCGDGACEAGETCSSCGSDCGACPPVCGDGTCNGTEDSSSCPGDCPTVCGNEVCESGESCSDCANDCGACAPVCGNTMCEIGEACSTCTSDCGACPPVCGDGTCNGNEDCASCSSDCGECPVAAPGTGTPGYWMNHPEAWPVEQLTIGGVVYTKAQLIAIMKHPTNKDVTYIIAQHVIAAMLNVGVGNESSCIDATIAAANAWLAQHPIGSNVKGGGASSPWKVGQPLSNTLDQYNNGLLCAPHRD